MQENASTASVSPTTLKTVIHPSTVIIVGIVDITLSFTEGKLTQRLQCQLPVANQLHL